MLELRSARGGYFGADKNLSVGKSNDIGGSRNIEKIAVHLGHRPSPENRHFDGIQRGEFGMIFPCDFQAFWKSGADKSLQQVDIVGNGSLAMMDGKDGRGRHEIRQRIFPHA